MAQPDIGARRRGEIMDHIHRIAGDVSKQIEEAEVATDMALIALSTLVASATQARLDAGLTSKEARPTIMRLMAAMETIVATGNHVVRAHGDCRKFYGDLAPDIHPTTPKHAKLRVEEAARRAEVAEQRHLSAVA